MYKKLFNIMVMMISMLTLNLLTGWITGSIVHYDTGINPYKYTAIAMLALVFILVPAYGYLTAKVEILVARVLLSGSNSFGRALGLLLSFALIFTALFVIYLYQWFDIRLWEVLRAKM